MKIFAAGLLCALALATTSPADALARDRNHVVLDRHVAAERVLQLSPSAGVAVEYRGGLARAEGQVVFQGNVPVGVVGPGGQIKPMGGFKERRATTIVVPPPSKADALTVIEERTPAPRHALVAPAPRKVAPHPAHSLDPAFLPQTVHYSARHAPGTIVIDTRAKFLYLVQPGGQALRYGVGVGRQGFSWKGTERVTRKAEWPGWTPPKSMIERERARGVVLPAHMPGGPENPLGARALYLGSTLYRIHGTNQPWTIGQAVSSGCIRMRNEDVIDLYGRVPVGARVVVL